MKSRICWRDTIAAHAPQPICWPGISAALIRGAKVAKGLPVAGGENGLSGGVSPLPNTPPQRHAPEHGDNLRATMTIL